MLRLFINTYLQINFIFQQNNFWFPAQILAGELTKLAYGGKGPLKLLVSADEHLSTIESWFRCLETTICKELQTTNGFNSL